MQAAVLVGRKLSKKAAGSGTATEIAFKVAAQAAIMMPVIVVKVAIAAKATATFFPIIAAKNATSDVNALPSKAASNGINPP
jgi:hypothetical protein